MPLAAISLDRYTRRARLTPALLVSLPLALAILAWFPVEHIGLGTLTTVATSCGVILLLAHFGRDLGTTREAKLFAKWGGKPTTRLMRHREAVNPTTLRRWHDKLSALMQTQLPSPEDEQKDPRRADQIYDDCTTFLREQTRDHKKFSLIFEENCNYGFRRNLWAMRPIGIPISALGTMAALAPTYYLEGAIPPVAIGAGAINLCLLMGWLFWFTPSWVRIAAEAYAERLLEATGQL